MRIYGDYHIHSQYSHGKGNIEKNIEAAIARGLRELAITDHGPCSWNFIRLGVRDAAELLEIKKEVKELQKKYPQIRLYAGVEANIINREGELDVPEGILQELDIVAAGFHLLIYPPDFHSFQDIILNNRFFYKCFPARRKQIRKFNTEVLIRAVERYRINFITHPGYGIDIDTYELARACAGRGTLLEINARHVEELRAFIQAAARTEVKFIINSDAHAPEEVGDFKRALELVEELGLSPDRIVNIFK